MNIVKNVKFYNGYEIPMLGLGTWKSEPGDVEQAVMDAIDIGYRHFDNARIYLNEKEVGKAINSKIEEGAVSRENLFITSKLWNTFHRPDLVEKACRDTLNDLELEYLDLYLIHFPFGFAEGDGLGPTDEKGNIRFSDVDYVDTWKAMENLVEIGLVKSIGVSNFNCKQLERLLKNCAIKPVTNQIECHPYLTQIKLSKWMKQNDIVLTSYSPLGSPDSPGVYAKGLNLLTDERLIPFAEKYGKTPAQILIRYHIDRDFVVIPKTIQKHRLEENFNVFDFQLSTEDIEILNSFDCNGRILTMMGYGHTHKYYPFNDLF